LTKPERFSAETLSDKIDGKAPLYLSAGFRDLRTQRASVGGDSGQWFEIFVYDMGEPRNAYAVFSEQRRASAEPLAFVENAYRTSNGVYFTHGAYYVEIVAAPPAAEQTEPARLAFARRFVGETQVEAAELGERELLPEKGLDPDSITLQPANVFGFGELDNVFTADYRLGGETVTAFLSRRESPAEADRLAEAYAGFLTDMLGGAPVDPAEAPEGATVVELFGTYEVVFARGALLAGVHEAPSRQAAVELARRLYAALQEASR
jgi:hypothetical protein